MTTLTFDTLDAAKTLRSAGVDEKTAEAIVTVVQRTTELPDIGHLATKDQVELLRVEVGALEKRLVGSISELRGTLFALFGMNIATVLGMGAFLYTVLKH